MSVRPGARVISSHAGIRATPSLFVEATNSGVSSMLTRIHTATPTSRIEARNGSRQPQVRNASPDHTDAAVTAAVESRVPIGEPTCTIEAISGLRRGSTYSMAISVAPPHSPPVAMPCSTRSTVSRIGARIPADA